MKKIVLFLIGTLVLGSLQAQVGINTTTPQAMLHVKSRGSTAPGKALSVVDNTNKEVLTILDNGNMGLGVTNPTIAVDLRDGTDGSILGIGQSAASPAAAAAGALKYDSQYSSLFLSDGSVWKAQVSSIPKTTVLTDLNTSSQTFLSNGLGVNIVGWNIPSDPFNSFNPLTGIFTAPHDGLYTVSAMLNLNPASVATNSNIELRLVSSNGVSISGVTTYTLPGTISIYVRCSGSFSLQKNQTIALLMYNNLGVNVTLSANKEYNKLSILES